MATRINGSTDGHTNGHVDQEKALLEKELQANADIIIDNVELNTTCTQLPRRRCKSCRQWGECCTDVCSEIKAGCSRCDCKGHLRKCCSVKKVKQKLPITKWLPKYRLPEFQGDLIAGLTVGLTVIPQGLAYAQVAELPAQYGLYSAFMGCFVYCLMGTSKDITLGPTAIMSLMTAEFGASWFHGDPTVAIVLTLFSGLIQFLMGLLNIGFLVEFISYPVINSFTTAAAITIAFGQIKKWLGLSNIPREFLHQVYYTFKYLPETNIWDMVLGLCCMILLYGMKRMKNIQYNDNGQPIGMCIRISRKFIWLIGTARNAIIVIVAAGLAAVLLHYGIDEFSLTKEIDPGLPPFQVPKFTTTDGNTTYYAEDIFKKIGSGFFIIPLIGLIETIAIGKAFARKNSYSIEANQELLAIGAANILGAFVSSYPVTGSFSRTAVNSQSGVKTPAGGIWTAGLVLLSLGVLTPLFKYIPDAALAGVIIMAVLDMASFAMLIKLWQVKRLDLIPWLVTFIFSFVLGIEYGIMIGVGVSVMFLLFPWARPGLNAHQRQVAVVELSSGLRFPGIEYVKDRVLKESNRDDIPKPIVLDCSHLSALDYSTANGLVGLFEDFKLKKATLFIASMQPAVLKTLESVRSPLVRYAPTVNEAIRQIYEEAAPEEDNPRMGLLSAQVGSSSINKEDYSIDTPSSSRSSTSIHHHASTNSLHSDGSHDAAHRASYGSAGHDKVVVDLPEEDE